MLIGVELIEYKNTLIEQKKRFDDYFKDLHRVDDVNYFDHLYLIVDLYETLINSFEFISESFITDNNLFNELISLKSSIWELGEEVKIFFNQDYIINNEVRHSTEDNATLVRIENLLLNTINHWSRLKSDVSERKLLNELYDFKKEKEKIDEEVNELKNVYEGWKNRDIYEIFVDDSDKFNKLARNYEYAFYAALAFLFLYFFGWYIEIDTANFKFKFAEQFHGNHTPTFYVQKISLLILSTTLAAFLLKRSFMNRRLADDAYRTAKELDALPRYMEGMPDEMKEKIRFDLAYKYFGNGIHHESYTGGENLMHENIKANTDFIKAVKDLTPKVEVPKAEAVKEEKPDKAVA